MLIQHGKEEGWLHLDVFAFKSWAVTNGIEFISTTPAQVPGRGVGLLASKTLPSDSSESTVLLTVPEQLVLSVEAVKEHALFDQDFREVLESLGDFGKTPRGAILSFLLFQASVSCPLPTKKSVGVHCPFTDYVKSLPCELLPTFWYPEELELLVGTTLAPAVSSKLKSLKREYDLLCESSKNTRWFKLVEPLLALEDWLHVDAMFRSRALDFHGSCMIPGMDLASHAAGDRTNARYDRDDGKYFLRLMDNMTLENGHEVTITYGDEKGACEMLFSYGFIDDHMDTAETLFLSLGIPDNDVSRAAKMKAADCAPGFKIIDVSNGPSAEENTKEEGQIDWEGDFVWLLCAGEEDGLRFELARTVDGHEPEMQALFGEVELTTGASHLRRLLAQSELWPVYKLRAIVILQQRVFDQLQLLCSTQEDVEAMPHGGAEAVRSSPYELALKLRRLEFELLEKAYEDFERQKAALAEDAVVVRYLSERAAEQPEEDFA